MPLLLIMIMIMMLYADDDDVDGLMMVYVTSQRFLFLFLPRRAKLSVPFKWQAADNCYLTHNREPIGIGAQAEVRELAAACLYLGQNGYKLIKYQYPPPGS